MLCRQQLDEEGLGDVPQKMLEEFERVFGLKFAKGHNPNVHFLAHLWEPLRSVYRPLMFYILTEFSGGFQACFRRSALTTVAYSVSRIEAE